MLHLYCNCECVINFVQCPCSIFCDSVTPIYACIIIIIIIIICYQIIILSTKFEQCIAELLTSQHNSRPVLKGRYNHPCTVSKIEELNSALIREGIDQSLALREFVSDFTYIVPFLNLSDSNGLRPKIHTKFWTFSSLPVKIRGGVSEVSEFIFEAQDRTQLLYTSDAGLLHELGNSTGFSGLFFRGDLVTLFSQRWGPNCTKF